MVVSRFTVNHSLLWAFPLVKHPHTIKYHVTAVCADVMETACNVLGGSVYSSLTAS